MTDTATASLANELAAFVGTTPTGPAAGYLTACATQATALVDAYLATNRDRVPSPVLARAYLEVGADLYHRRTARNGITGFEDTEVSTAPVRINRDPLAPAYPLLARYTGPAIA
jgi:hypothetical protein